MSVSTRLKRMTVAALGVVAVIAGVLLITPHFVSEYEARNAAVRALRDATGVEPRIEGPVRLTLLPRPAVRIENVRLEDGKRPAFTAAALRATVQILPLLSGHVQIASLTFEQPRLSVEVAGDGAFLIGIPLRPRTATEPPMQPEIRFVEGTVHFKDTHTDNVEPLSNVDAALAWSGAGLTASGSFEWRGAPASLSLSIADTTAFGRGDRTGFRVRIETEPLKVGFDGGIAYRNGVQADGVLAAEAKSLRDGLKLLSFAPLTRGGFGPFKLKAQAALTANSLALTGLSIDLDGNRAAGGLTAKYDGGRAVIQATLASEASNFTPYSGGFAVNGDDERDWSREPIDLAALDKLDLDVRFSSGRVVVRKTELTRVAATVSMRNGKFTLTVGDAQFHGGSLRGRAALGKSGDGTPEVKIEANIADFDLAPGLAELAGIQRIEGKGTLVLALDGAGKHVHAITRGLSGGITFAAKDGVLNGINVEQVLRRLERKPLSGAPDFMGGRTSFDRLTAKLRVTEGTAKVEEANVESALVRVKLAGEASVVHRDFDLKGTATLVRAAAPANAAQSFDLPFLVIGPWDRPFLLPDPTALIQRSGAAAPLLDAARKQAAREKAASESDDDAEAAPGAVPATTAPAAAPAAEAR
ncbi:MAG: AsmA family protein [Xanthobacteraceae bacterium]